jgi:ABC-type antimicrobial peptide transport system permease subunit
MQRFGRALIIFLLGGVLGTGFGVALGFFFFPFVFPPPTATEQLLDQDRSPLVAAGTGGGAQARWIGRSRRG